MTDETPAETEEWVTIHHPQTGGESYVTKAAYESAWKDLGYRLGPNKAAADKTKES